ncbi:MAG TPA: hypothetical protein VK506_16195, partial [Conexibacter sp.]|nr:hypothetical protein [Conexibacter sp.]
MRSVSADGLDLLAADAQDATAWQGRLVRDRHRARALQSLETRRTTELLLARAISSGADAVALTGSTARGMRTA